MTSCPLPLMLIPVIGNRSSTRATGDKERRWRKKEGEEVQHTLNMGEGDS